MRMATEVIEAPPKGEAKVASSGSKVQGARRMRLAVAASVLLTVCHGLAL